jgi:O-antigen ligase
MAVVVFGILVASLSTQVRMRAEETINVLQGKGPQDESTLSTRTRLELLRNGVEVAREHWLLGTGWVNYPDTYRAVALQRNPDQPELPGSRTDNPHDEYLLQLGAGGLPGLLLFLAWLGWPMARALRAEIDANPWVGVGGSLAIAFGVSALFNSVLRDFVEAHFYAALMAWLMVRRIDRN